MEQTIKETIAAFKLPRYEDIPDVGLFLDQVTKYIMEYLKPLPSFSVTGSMISNYVKKGLVANPVKKQYGREQIAYLFFIVMAKTVLSLEDIQLIIQLQKLSYAPQQAYNYFQQELGSVLGFVFGLKSQLETIGTDATSEKAILRNTIIAVAHKVYIDQCLLESRKVRGAENGI